ncbi:MAG: hypothetical protein V2A76_05520 [Planctomycetota bacterium]
MDNHFDHVIVVEPNGSMRGGGHEVGAVPARVLARLGPKVTVVTPRGVTFPDLLEGACDDVSARHGCRPARFSMWCRRRLVRASGLFHRWDRVLSEVAVLLEARAVRHRLGRECRVGRHLKNSEIGALFPAGDARALAAALAHVRGNPPPECAFLKPLLAPVEEVMRANLAFLSEL